MSKRIRINLLLRELSDDFIVLVLVGAVLVARVNVRFIVILHDDVVTINFFDVYSSEKRVISKVKIGEDDPLKELKN